MDRVEDKSQNLRVTLQEIERLMAAAEQSGAPVPDWFAQLATELRSATPADGEIQPDLVDRILSDPRLSLDAQANLHPGALRFLKG
jgi:hypothetical protein